jgi:hypothetical protein
VHVTSVAEALVAVTVAVAPSVSPDKSMVGVESDVVLSVELVPVSELVFRSGAEGFSMPTIGVAEEVPTTLSATFVPVTTDRM